jgi:hypothetical protein
METLTVDDHKRIRIPDAKPRTVFAYEKDGNGKITLTGVKAQSKPPYPKGSLTIYFTGKLGRERDELESVRHRGSN